MKISREFILGDHTLNSHDLSDGLRIDIRRRSFMLIDPLLGLKGLMTSLRSYMETLKECFIRICEHLKMK